MAISKLLFSSKASFKRQLLFIFTASVIILAITTSFVTAWQTSQKIRKSTIETGIQIADNLAKSLVLAVLTENQENGQDAINNALGFQSVHAVAIYKNNRELLVSTSKQSGKFAPLIVEKIPSKVTLVNETNNDWTFAAPVSYVVENDGYGIVEPEEESTDAQVIGYVILNYNKQALHTIQQSIFINNFAIGSLMAFLLALLMHWLINRMTRPLLALSHSMEMARDSGHYTKADVNGAFEIRQMASTYNQMMSTLEQQNIELEKNRNTLESEVEIRTQELIVARDTALTASRHKSEFLANISHELRTPLQAIIGYTDLVREELEIECMDAQVEDLNKSIRSAHNLLSLINNILDLAKIEAGRMDLYLKNVDIKQLVDETVETVKPMADANHNDLVLHYNVTQPTLNIDRQKLMQVFLNLLSNACKFTKGGQITFDIYNNEHFLYFSVADTGVGIPEDKLEFILEKFTQVDGSTTRKFEGTGLGMAITQNFCQLMLGTLKVESELGSGTKFSVKLPLLKT
ncbi:sensor histidine kinase [Colwelliaceae bacterium 6471]